MNLRRHPSAALALLLAVLYGCGSTPPPRSAKEEITKAERFVDSARDWDRKGQIDQALDNYKQAKESISKGISFAEGNELSKLRYMEEEVRGAVTSLEVRKQTQEASKLEKPKVAANAQLKAEDPEEKKHKEAEAAKKKLEAGEARATAAIDDLAKAVSAPALTVKKEEEKDAAADSDVAEKKEKPKAADKEKPSEEPAPPAVLKAAGPFPVLDDKSPPIQICKLETQGNFAIVYFQVYNNAEAGRRIMNAVPFFKDANNQALVNPQATAVFPYNGFKANIANVFEQPLVTALTIGSAQVTGFEGLRLVGVGECEKIKDLKKVSVKVIYDDGKSVDGTGPTEGSTEVPGLKALQAKK